MHKQNIYPMTFKSQIAVVLFVFLIPLFLIGQAKIEVIQKSVKMSQGEQPAYIVMVPESNYDQVLKEWTKIIRQNTKSKVEETEHEIIIKGTQISEISENSMNIYSAVIKADSSVKIVAVYEIDSTFFSFTDEQPDLQTEKTHHHIKHFMREFAVKQYKYSVGVELSEAEKLLKTKNKELKELGKQNEVYQKEMKESEQNIKNSEDLISSYEQDNERKLSEINSKKESIASLSGNEDLSGKAKDQLKALEKEKRNIEDKLEKEQNNIVKYQSNIEDLTKYIEDNSEKQLEKKAGIDKQEDVVNATKIKLEWIK